jgi:uncharacterized membrane protein
MMIDVGPGALLAAKWIGTAAGVLGAILIALDLGRVFVWYGYWLFLVSSVLWAAVGVIQSEPSLVVLQLTFTAINLLGLRRWAGTAV